MSHGDTSIFLPLSLLRTLDEQVCDLIARFRRTGSRRKFEDLGSVERISESDG
jgi:hypothetical protein